jgi:hypothetical protein
MLCHRSNSGVAPALLYAGALAAVGLHAETFGQEVAYLRPRLSDVQLSKLSDGLQLRPEDRDIVETLYRRYLEQHRDSLSRLLELQDRYIETAEEQPNDAAQLAADHRAALQKFLENRRRAEIALLSEIQAVIALEQLECCWAKVIRMLNRADIKDLRGTTAARWYSVDLIRIVEESGLDPSEKEKIQQILDEYEVELDRPLAERRQMWDEEANWPPEKRQQDSNRLVERNYHLANRVGTINKRYAHWVLSVLSDDSKLTLSETVTMIAYPSVFESPRPAQVLLSRTAGLTDLTQSQTDQIKAIRESYGRDSKLLDTIAIQEYDKADDLVARWFRRQQNDETDLDDYPEFQIFGVLERRRQEFELQTQRRIDAILTNEQLAQLNHNGNFKSEPRVP